MDRSRRRLLLGVPALAAAVLITPPAAAASTSPVRERQSPIHIRSRQAVTAPGRPAVELDYPSRVDLRVHYVSKDSETDPAGCTVRGREEVVEAEVPEGSAAVHLGDTRYELLQFHFHTPAEHLLDGNRFPIEQHFVHRGPDGEALVLSLLLTGGGSGGSLTDDVLGTRPEECGPEHEVHGDLAAALPADLSTFRYTGSLTTDPYTEPVSWLVLAHQRPISDASVDALPAVFPDGDARDPQPLNGRTIHYHPQPRT